MTIIAIPRFAARNSAEALWLLPVAGVATTLLFAAQLIGAFFGLSPLAMLRFYTFKALRMLPILLIAALAYQILIAVKSSPGSPATELLARLRGVLADPWMLAARVAPLLLMPIVFVGFSSLKMLMPQFVPFYLDDAFAAADRILFFGHQPWEITHAVFGSPAATGAIDFFYTMWVLLLSVAIGVFALFAPRPDRARFFLAFTFAWLLLGTVGAWLLASAGPCYSALIGASSAPEFAGLIDRMTFLSSTSEGGIEAPDWQQVLWRSHATQTYSFGMGISAMPSLHNAIATLYALAAYRVGRMLGGFMTIYAVIIFVGSVHLGWHYAVDGIVGSALMILIWRAVDHWCVRSGYDAAVARDALPEASR